MLFASTRRMLRSQMSPTSLSAVWLLLVVVLTQLFWTPAVGAAQGQSAAIHDVRFGEHGGLTRVVFDLAGAARYRIFSLSGPDRLVIDLPGAAWHAETPFGDGMGLVSRYRSGQFDAATARVVLDLASPVEIVDLFTLPAQNGRPTRLVLDLKPARAGAVIQAVSPGEAGAAPQPVLAPVPGPAPRDLVPPQREATPRRVPVIVLDAGHGGVDPGAIAVDGTYEKTIALAVTRALRDELMRMGGFQVILTRDSDVYIPLRERVAIARRAGADLFLSIHADSLDRPGVRGASVYTLSETASDAETAKLAARENRSDIIAGVDLGTQQDDVANILIDLAMRETKNQSKRLANGLVNGFRAGDIALLERPHRSAGFAVLKAPDVPSVLVEVGFLSDRREAAQLRDRRHQQRIAQVLARGVERFAEDIELTAR